MTIFALFTPQMTFTQNLGLLPEKYILLLAQAIRRHTVFFGKATYIASAIWSLIHTWGDMCQKAPKHRIRGVLANLLRKGYTRFISVLCCFLKKQGQVAEMLPNINQSSTKSQTTLVKGLDQREVHSRFLPSGRPTRQYTTKKSNIATAKITKNSMLLFSYFFENFKARLAVRKRGYNDFP